MKYITIFSDASHCHETKAAGIAIWARDADKFFRRSKALTFPVDGPTTAECIALGTAILSVIEEFDHQPGDQLSIQSDCLAALDLFAGSHRKKPWPAMEADLKARVLKSVSCSGLSLHPKHVKGHRGNVNSRSAVNTWCDVNARKAMRKARRILAQPKPEPPTHWMLLPEPPQ